MEEVSIQTKPCDGNPTGIVRLNKCDFDPRIHQLADEASYNKFTDEEKEAFEKQPDEELRTKRELEEKDRLEKEEKDRVEKEKTDKAEKDRLEKENAGKGKKGHK